jgi:hypothetical protein
MKTHILSIKDREKLNLNNNLILGLSPLFFTAIPASSKSDQK